MCKIGDGEKSSGPTRHAVRRAPNKPPICLAPGWEQQTTLFRLRARRVSYSFNANMATFCEKKEDRLTPFHLLPRLNHTYAQFEISGVAPRGMKSSVIWDPIFRCLSGLLTPVSLFAGSWRSGVGT